ncbi:MAG TPA: preprotein translocase subunit Sec61beta [Candidatus Woesearchaeota archaeon]|nr:preprotein translocase subunit Sec61beta [Candidatus Woesearchaeota archaeon]
MAKEQLRVPMSMGGLVRYSDEYKSKFQLSPGAVIIIAVLIIILVIALSGFGLSLIGLRV